MIKVFDGTVSQTTQPHRHRVHEFIVRCNGDALLCTEQGNTEIGKGRTLLVPSGEYHHYQLARNVRKAELTFICFDNEILERQFSPEIQSGLLKLLESGASTAVLDKKVAQENSALVDIIMTTSRSNDLYSQYKAMNVLGSMLITHLMQAGNPDEFRRTGNYGKIRKFISWLDENRTEDMDLNRAAARTHMSRSSFTRNFKKYTKLSFNDYLTRSRLELSADLLMRSEYSVQEVAENSGFKNLGHYYRQFQSRYKMTPSQYRRMSVAMQNPGNKQTEQLLS